MTLASEPNVTDYADLGFTERTIARIRLTLILAWVLVCLPFYIVSVLNVKARMYCGRTFWRGVLRLSNVKLRVRGSFSKERPLLFVSNHVSYMDIAVLASLIPGYFVAKDDVSSWPGIGPIARLAGTIFVARKRTEAAKQKIELAAHLSKGMPLILFPEGTSNDGNRVLPFKSTLFSIAEKEVNGKPVMVQPIALAYTECRGLPIGYAWRHFFAWYGDMELAPHLWALLHLGQLTVDVEFLPVQSLADLGTRKNAAAVCQEIIRSSVSRALSGDVDRPLP